MHNLIYFTRNAGKVQGTNGKRGNAGRAMALGGRPFVRLPAICSLPVTPTQKGL
ncbi:MAG: hypothetical protein U0K76_07940 [Dialister sp.]|nr:hypothetical protein [Dialister sp.]